MNDLIEHSAATLRQRLGARAPRIAVLLGTGWGPFAAELSDAVEVPYADLPAFPRLAIGGREIFFAEASGPDDEKVAPQIKRTASLLWRLYAILTLLQILALRFTGMPLFDSACNTFGTIAAAGFSPHPLSIAGYQNPAAEWVIIVFMFLAGANFALQYRALARRDYRIFTSDDELRAYVAVIVLATLTVAVIINGREDGGAPVRTALFQVLSIMTTTGFASVDFQLWNDQAKAVLLGLMFIGGCAGSAGGGPKVVRHVVLARFTFQELRRMLHPRAILPVKLNGRVVPASILQGVVVFFLFYLLTFAVCSAIVILLGADLVTGISATAATLGNVGPGFNLVGPMANFADLHPISRVTLTETTFNELPYRFEAGTPNIADAIGLGAAIDFLATLDQGELAEHENALRLSAESLLRQIDGVTIVGEARAKAPVVSFSMRGAHPHDVATLLDQQGIAVRAGHHCAMPLMDALGLPGTVRASFALYNTQADVNAFIAAVHKARSML